MRRMIAVLCAAVLLLGLCACAVEPAVPSSTAEPSTEPTTTEPPTTEATEPTTTEPPTTEPPEPYVVRDSFAWVYPATSGTIWALAFSIVENTGSENLFLDFGSMVLTDDNGRTVGEIDSVSAYPQILAPGKVGYYCDVIALDIGEVQHLNVEFSAPIEETQKSAQRYSTSELELTDTEFGGMLLEGVVTNSSEETSGLVCVSAILYDKDKAPAGFICGYLEDPLEPGESAGFSFESFMLPSYLKWEDVSNYKVYAYSLEKGP